MHEMIDFTTPTRCIVHYAASEGRGLPVYYQVTICSESISPSGVFIRFTHGVECTKCNPDADVSEIHGWVRISDLVIDEILEELNPAFLEQEPQYG